MWRYIVVCTLLCLVSRSLVYTARDSHCHDLYPKSDGIVFHILKDIPKLRHTAVIGYGDKDDTEWSWGCSGSLISEKFVLTAAHCIVSPSNVEPSWVRLGTKDFSSEKNQRSDQDFTILRSIVHPDYHVRNKYNDIALVELDGKVKFTDDVSPACLQTEKDVDENSLFTIFWEQRAKSMSLEQTNMQYISNENCNNAYKASFQLERRIDDEIQICAQNYNNDTTCQPISGGALQVLDQARKVYTIVGVISFSKSCMANSPIVTTRVSHYIPWIESVVWPNKTH